jgi:RimJ/RimL family protein N-acetyltransferase
VTIELRGRAVTLRAFRPEEYERVLRRMPGSNDGDREKGRFRRERVERSGTRTSVELLLGVEAGGRLVGDVQARSVEMAMPPGVWELGVELWEDGDRGRGVGREAVALLTSYLFDEEGAHRVQASTDVDNAAMRRVLEVLGFTDEGTLRGFMPGGDGPPRDYAMYGTTKDDWETARKAWTPTS